MNCLRVPSILMPEKDIDLSKWSVIACDQYTSQPEYWEETEKVVGKMPSTLNLILPEVYLESEDVTKRIEQIHNTMNDYLKNGVLQELPKGFVLVERKLASGLSRNGLVVEIDLETYEYKKGEHSLIRPTEMTVEERIPPRLKVRQTAALELPHIMLLIDDPDCSIIEQLVKNKDKFEKIYDTDLMQQGGRITGWMIKEGKETDEIMQKVERLADSEVFKEKYNLQKSYPLLNLAVGDGNHSMATAKAAWENIKKTLSEEEKKNHPARYCLCELVNIHDQSLEIEPIHRVLFNMEEEELVLAAKDYYEKQGCSLEIEEGMKSKCTAKTEHSFCVCNKNGWKVWTVSNPVWGIPVATLQSFLDEYLRMHKECKIDYIHGKEVVETLGKKENNIGFLLPEINKEDIFRGVILDGVLPRKTFSMGEANEKRYYMESKKIIG